MQFHRCRRSSGRSSTGKAPTSRARRSSPATGSRLLVGALAAAACLVSIATTASAFPRPAPVPYRWELHFYPGDLRLHEDAVTGRAYWYFTYQVVNRTGRTQIWAPQVTCYTDAGEIMTAGDGVPSQVEVDIMTRLGNPLLEPQLQIIGDIRVGPENAKDGIAVWPAPSTDVNELSIFVRGISGESTRVTNPVTGEPVVLYKTLQRDYLIPGNALARGSKPAELVSQAWILR